MKKEATIYEFIQDKGVPEARGTPEGRYIKMEEIESTIHLPPHTYSGTVVGHWGEDTVCFKAGAGHLRVNSNHIITWETKDES